MTDNTITQSVDDFDWFGQNGIFMPMINDTGRNIFYKQAIESSVAGRVVCDIGAGTGFLSVLAAKAGAKKVFAVEMDPGRAKFVQSNIEKVGLSDTIEVVSGNFLDLDVQADIYVSETIGTQIFNENIIEIADHARQYRGTFLPGKFEVYAKVYKNHPIFICCQNGSDAFEFQPDIAIDPAFESTINQVFQQQHPLGNTLYRANSINKLFRMLPVFTDLKLETVYTTDTITVDLNQPVNVNDIQLTIPGEVLKKVPQLCVVLFWRAIYNDLVMDSNDTWWGNVSKIITKQQRNGDNNVVTWYDPVLGDWRFSF